MDFTRNPYGSGNTTRHWMPPEEQSGQRKKQNTYRGADGKFTPQFLERSAVQRKRVMEKVREKFKMLVIDKPMTYPKDRRGSFHENQNMDGFALHDVDMKNKNPIVCNGWRTRTEAMAYYNNEVGWGGTPNHGLVVQAIQNNWEYLHTTDNVGILRDIYPQQFGKCVPGDKDVNDIIHRHLLGRNFIHSNHMSGDRVYYRFDDKNQLTAFYAFAQDGNIILAADEVEMLDKYLELVFEGYEWPIGAAAMLTVHAIDDYGRPHTTETMLSESGQMAHPLFYPWFGDDLHTYFQEYMDSEANVLLLLGDPGTGKSTFLRTGLRMCGVRAMVATKPDVFMHPQFVPIAMNLLHDDKIDVVIVEDADMYVRSREDNNHRMSELLNATNGIDQSLKAKFIFTTNLKTISTVDPALLRPGRAFDYLVFQKLTSKHCSSIRTALNRPPLEFPKDRGYTLAEALAVEAPSSVNDGIIKPRFGAAKTK